MCWKSAFQVYPGISYTTFLVPGLIMMSMLENAFANSSSSLIQSKITGNIVFVLVAPLSYLEFFSAYLLAAVIRGLVVGVGVGLMTVWFADLPLMHPFGLLALTIFSTGILSVAGAGWVPFGARRPSLP